MGNPPYGGIGVDFQRKLTPENQQLLEELSGYEVLRWRARKQTGIKNENQSSIFDVPQATELPTLSQTDVIKYAQGTPIEVLFLERFIKLAKEGAWIAAIIPDGILANANLSFVREYVSNKTKILAIISLPRGTFKHVGTNAKTSILLLRKKRANDLQELGYRVFLASANTLAEESFIPLSASFHSFIYHE